MARTRASVAAKVVTGKSSKARCSAAPPPSSTASISGAGVEKNSRNHSGGNPVCPRETPKWQKPITNFFIQNQTGTKNGDEDLDKVEAGSSKPKPKRNIIHSDSEEEQTDKPKNKVLDETIELEPLKGDDSHKMNEYYATKDKENKTKSNKEIKHSRTERKKRHLDELLSNTEEMERSEKKIKLH